MLRQDGRIQRWMGHCETYSEALRVANAAPVIKGRPVIIIRGQQQGKRFGEVKKVIGG